MAQSHSAHESGRQFEIAGDLGTFSHPELLNLSFFFRDCESFWQPGKVLLTVWCLEWCSLPRWSLEINQFRSIIQQNFSIFEDQIEVFYNSEVITGR